MDITHSPYKGLMPYTEEDADFFFGRDRDCAIITANLFASRLTILFGASGVGKSSVLQAGVAHNLRRKEGIAVVVFSDWHEAPLDNLRQAVQDEMERVLGTGLDQEEALSFKDFLADCASRMDGQLVIILDQFEEYLLYHPGDKGPGSFVTEFVRVVNSRDVPVSFLIAIREDSLAKLDRFKGRIPQLFGNYLRLDHLDEKAAREAIEKPLEKVGWEWEAELVETVIDQVRVGRIGLGEVGRGEIREPSEAEARVRIETPFLQIVMTCLWDEEQAHNSRQIHKRTLDDLGGAKQIVRDYLDAFMDGLPRKHQALSAAIFHYLVTPSGAKIAQSARDLAVYANQDREQIAQVLNTLAGPARLLRTVAAARAGGEPRYEIYHDSLAPAVLHWRGNYYQEQREIRVRRWGTWAIGLVFFVALASLANVLGAKFESSTAQETAIAADSAAQTTALAADARATVAKATAQAGAETATAALDSEIQATADFHVWQTAQAQATAASIQLVTAMSQHGGKVDAPPPPDPTATAAVETATAAAQSLQIAEQKVVAAAAELKATATAAASATAAARELTEQLQTAGLMGRGVKVAIVATGIDPDHPDFARQIVAGVSFVGDKRSYRDDNGLGTCLASMVAGNGTASRGLYKGWAPEADLYIAKVADAEGASTLSDVIAGIEWAVKQEVDIVLVPLGSAPGCDGSDALSQEADAAVKAGLVVVVPAGNSGPEPGTVESSGCARLPITVGAAELNTVANFSSRGPTPDGRTKPDLLFPHSGVGAQATGTKIGSVVAPGYVEITGSGISAAHAAGAIALLLQADPDLTPAEVKDLLMETATDLGFDANAQGAGLADIEEALARVRDRDGDGIPDVEDACPDEFGSSLAGGCPEPTPTKADLRPLTGNELIQITKDSADEYVPSFSPDQRTLLLMSNRTGDWQIFTLNPDGSNWKRLTEGGNEYHHARFSPDGKRIIFSSDISGDFEIYTMATDGTGLRRLTYSDGSDTYPSYSLNGQRIVFMSKRSGTWGVYTMSADGSGQRAVIDTDATEAYPYISPDGQSVVLQSDVSGNYEIYLISIDGGEPRQLTNNPARDADPVFPPDGRSIVFETNRDGDYEIYAMDSDGSNQRNLTNFPSGNDQVPSISPDGLWVVFQSDRNGSWDIFRTPLPK